MNVTGVIRHVSRVTRCDRTGFSFSFVAKIEQCYVFTNNSYTNYLEKFLTFVPGILSFAERHEKLFMKNPPPPLTGFLLERTSKLMKKQAQRLLKQAAVGVTVDQWVILQELAHENGLSQYELAQRTVKDAPTVTRIIDLLCEKKLLERRPDVEDRRRFRIFLTRAGRKKYEQIYPLIRSFRENAFRGLSANERKVLTEFMHRIKENLKTE